MNVQVTARHTPLTPELKTFCDKRLAGLAKLMSLVTEVDVILASERNRQRAEIHVKSKGAGLVVVEDSHDLLQSLNRAFDSLEHKLKKEREKIRDKKRRGGRERKARGTPQAEPAEPGLRILKADFYSAKPMALEEAVIEFNLRKKEVFVFRSGEGRPWSVLFRRKDGNFGLVEPE